VPKQRADLQRAATAKSKFDGIGERGEMGGIQLGYLLLRVRKKKRARGHLALLIDKRGGTPIKEKNGRGAITEKKRIPKEERGDGNLRRSIMTRGKHVPHQKETIVHVSA